MTPPQIIYFDAWHTLFTVRSHGPQRLGLALNEMGYLVEDLRIQQAIEAARLGMHALNLPFIATPEQERHYMVTRSRLLMQSLGLVGGDDYAERLTDLSDYVPYCFLYDDVLPTLDALQDRGQRVGVLSNAFPSLLDALTRLGVIERFDPLIVSALVGCEKPDPCIFQAALAAAGTAPDETVFVDDLPENVEAADALGLVGVLIDRDGQHAGTRWRRVTRLTELLDWWKE